ncbi:MAG: hypothetical protein MHPSP_001758 [Paramarteilia canceri]
MKVTLSNKKVSSSERLKAFANVRNEISRRINEQKRNLSNSSISLSSESNLSSSSESSRANNMLAAERVQNIANQMKKIQINKIREARNSKSR